jgi:ubiquitin-like modifier-activating enzyme ATG7
MTIPMPGHPVDAASLPAAMETVAKLDSLVSEHDVVFLLTDSRESRWLPTLLCAEREKVLRPFNIFLPRLLPIKSPNT